MSDVKDKVEDGIESVPSMGPRRLANKAEEATEKAAHKTSEAATAVGNKVEEAGEKIKDAGH